MNLIQQSLLQAGVLEHLAVDGGNFLVIDEAMNRWNCCDKRSANFIRRNAFFGGLASLLRDIEIFPAASTSSPSSSAALVCFIVISGFGFDQRCRRFNL